MNGNTIEELFNTPRMGHVPLSATNSVRGLYRLIKKYFKPEFTMVEIGSFHGVSTRLFSKFVKTVYAVDCYDYVVPETGRIPEHDALFVEAEKIFIEKTTGIKNIIKVRKTSVEAAKDFAPKSVDAVYIDAEHDEVSVRKDIQTWKGKIKNGGILCGHDFNLPHIKKILNEEGFKKIDTFPDSSWAVIVRPTTALIAVASTKVPQTIKALKKSLKQMEFSKVLLFTNEDVEVKGIKTVKIPKLDYKSYNEFIAMYLWNYIDTEYVLLVQNDGYILDANIWDDVFFDYDYIGAPWERNTHFTKDGTEVRVGNGGFSFRSKKLLEAPTKLGLKFTDMGTGYWHEDGFLCVHYRRELEEYGIKFAPVNVAAKFSTEMHCPESVPSFGFHNLKNVPRFHTIRTLMKKIIKR